MSTELHSQPGQVGSELSINKAPPLLCFFLVCRRQSTPSLLLPSPIQSVTPVMPPGSRATHSCPGNKNTTPGEGPASSQAPEQQSDRLSCVVSDARHLTGKVGIIYETGIAFLTS